MDLISRARAYIEGPVYHPIPFHLLLDCVVANDREGLLAATMLAADAYDDSAFNLTVKVPAACSLFAWREEGMEALIGLATKAESHGDISIVIPLLTSVAAGHDPLEAASFMRDASLRNAIVDAAGDWTLLAKPARKHLNQIVLAIDEDATAALWAGSSLTQVALRDRGAIEQLARALALRWIAVGPEVLDEYEGLVRQAVDHEPTFQNYFERYPLLLDPHAYEAWSQPDLHGRLEPDLLIRRYDDSYVVVEIETPGKPIVTGGDQIGHHVTHAIGQVLQYQEYLRTHSSAASNAFPGIAAPSGLVVVGRESLLNDKQRTILRLENQSRASVRIVGFDRVAAIARAVTNNVIEGGPSANVRKRLP